MIAYLVTAEHWNVPGRYKHLHRSKEAATAKAVYLTNGLLRDADRNQTATSDDWESLVHQLEHAPRTCGCYVDLEELTLED